MKCLKKYPVTYKGIQYEVRWEPASDYDTSLKLTIYKVEHKQWWFKIKTIYTPVFSEYQSVISVRLSYSNRYSDVDAQDLYINEIKALFEFYEEDLQKKEFEKIQKDRLEAWDGVIK